ncbi:cytokinesis protein 3 [Arachnomyces sp. PD_36]|nr:cytokinesis protein 3 [Arachnomyces sp. PD_36]
MAEAPSLPTRFPCWCRAVYSWGGETKRDLGFVEGDLIECLNAGDGSWWMGRLRRDRRMVGLFPSNFVTVLEDDFVPGSGSVSPMTSLRNRGGSVSSASPHAAVPKPKKTVFRKPFQGYKEAVGPSEALKKTEPLRPSPVRHSTPPKTATKRVRTPLTAVKHQDSISRTPSRQVSPSPVPAPAPAPEAGSSPPPPPPPHRVAVNSNQAPRPSPSPVPYQTNDHYGGYSRGPSPAPPSPAVHGHTPSPLRDAMEDVMSSLQDMGLPRGAPSPEPRHSPTPFAPWSPEAFDHLHDENRPHPNGRPLTSLGLGNDDHYEEAEPYSNNHNLPDRYHDGPPQINNYVQRMESRLRQLHGENGEQNVNDFPDDGPDNDLPPPPPPKNVPYHPRSQSIPNPQQQLKNRKSAYELGRNVLGRTFTSKSSATNSSSGIQSNATNSTTSTGLTSQSIMSGPSAGGFSATSAGSFARRTIHGDPDAARPQTGVDMRYGQISQGRNSVSSLRPQTPLTGISYHSSHNSSRQGAMSAVPWSEHNNNGDSSGVFGGLTTPKTKKTGFLKKILDSAKTGAASARSNIGAHHGGGSGSPTKNRLAGISSFSSTNVAKDAARDMGLGGGGANIDWVQIRRDVNRSTSPSRNERIERAERCQMMDYPVIYAVEELYETAGGDEGIDGLAVASPTDWASVNLSLVDKSARFVNSLPPMTNPISLAQGYVCRPHRSDVQRLRAIFTWVAEKISWDEDTDEEIDLRRVIQTRRGCPEEVAALVMEMCGAVGLQAEVIHGYLKTPGEHLDLDSLSRPNHWWNAVLIDNEWRMMDASLASPTNPRRSSFVTSNSQAAESWYFLTRPMEICYSHIPLLPEQQHLCPPISPDVLLSLPGVAPPFFKNEIQVPNYDTSMVRIEGLEVVQFRVSVPPDVECAAEVEAQAFARDADGDFFESGDIIKKRALAQPDWANGQKRYTIKAVLPGDEGQGVLKLYAGKRGLMHSSKDITHPLALALPITHTGENPPYDFILRHPTPHAQRHDLYVLQPQCSRLAINNTFVFAVRQHPSSLPSAPPNEGNGRISPSGFNRPSSALSMVSASTSNPSTTSGYSNDPTSRQQLQPRDKPAKLAIQSPSGKILRLTRKADHMISTSSGADIGDGGPPDGSVWETVIKISERGVWRGLVLADRSARWCVWGEWECF